jgi:hypothetical protein
MLWFATSTLKRTAADRAAKARAGKARAAKKRAIAKARAGRVRAAKARAKVKGKLLTLGKKTRAQAEKLCKSAKLRPDVCLNLVAEGLRPKGRKKGKRRKGKGTAAN